MYNKLSYGNWCIHVCQMHINLLVPLLMNVLLYNKSSDQPNVLASSMHSSVKQRLNMPTSIQTASKTGLTGTWFKALMQYVKTLNKKKPLHGKFPMTKCNIP